MPVLRSTIVLHKMPLRCYGRLYKRFRIDTTVDGSIGLDVTFISISKLVHSPCPSFSGIFVQGSLSRGKVWRKKKKNRSWFFLPFERIFEIFPAIHGWKQGESVLVFSLSLFNFSNLISSLDEWREIGERRGDQEPAYNIAPCFPFFSLSFFPRPRQIFPP